VASASTSLRQPPSIPQTFPIPAMTTHYKTLYHIIRVHSWKNSPKTMRIPTATIRIPITCAALTTKNSLLTTATKSPHPCSSVEETSPF
jgi:hypothetical protein